MFWGLGRSERRHRWLLPFYVGLSAIVAAAAGINPPIAGDNLLATSGQVPPPTSITRTGNGDFSFDGPGALAGSPIHVWYNAPSSDVATAQILIVMTGAHRDGKQYREDWLPLVAGRHTLLLVLEFDRDTYPDSTSYNLGRLIDSRGRVQPQETWSFNLVEAVFDHVVSDVGSTATDYAIFGHSAGGQFVHRFIEFLPHSRARVAVAANAGWYTLPDDETPFPYGLKGSPVKTKQLRESFSRNLIVMLGTDDVDPHDKTLQRDKQTDKQGDNRLSRGLNFFATARKAASESTPFRWQLVTVGGVGHSHAGMAQAAAPLLLGPVR